MKKYLLPLLLITILFACKKDILENNQSATLHFSNDTVMFDTAFHSIGTPTQTLTIYNRNSFTVLTNISLNSATEDSFRMNVDGVPGNNQNAIEIPAKDSIFILLPCLYEKWRCDNNEPMHTYIHTGPSGLNLKRDQVWSCPRSVMLWMRDF